MFIERESFLHKKAKEVLKEWIDNSTCDKGFVDFRSTDVHLEYPICIFEDGSSSYEYPWDSIPTNDGSSCDDVSLVPTYNECITKYNTYPISIIDLMCMHKGHPYIGIEICYKNPVSQEKIIKLQNAGVQKLYEVDAQWVMNQIRIPKEIKCKRLI